MLFSKTMISPIDFKLIKKIDECKNWTKMGLKRATFFNVSNRLKLKPVLAVAKTGH